VQKNVAEKSVNNMLDYVEKNIEGPDAVAHVEEFYKLTIEAIPASKNERLWLKTNIKLTKLMLDRKDFSSVARKVRELHEKCQRNGSDDPAKGTYALEIYSIEIQMHTELKNMKQLKRLFHKSLAIGSAVSHPKIVGIIHECGGKMYMSEENWTSAHASFFESFRHYDEAGSLQRIQVLKYLLLSTMLSKSQFSPFATQETKPYKNDPSMAAMTQLVDAYQRNDMRAYEEVLRNNEDILQDRFIAENIDEVTRNMRTRGLLKLIAPYKRMRLDWISTQLQLPPDETRDIIGFLITDGRISGGIDEREGSLVLDSNQDRARADALDHYRDVVDKLHVSLLRDAPGFRTVDPAVAASLMADTAMGEGTGTGGGGGGGGSGAFPRSGRRKAKFGVSNMWT
jgi:COP9 signalosome complex subunit 2